MKIKNYDIAKSEGCNCCNNGCFYYDDTGKFDQRCSAGDRNDNPYLPKCKKYIPYLKDLIQ